MRMAVLLLAALAAGDLVDVLRWQSPQPESVRGRESLRCFTAAVLARTKPGDSIRFIVPTEDADGGLVNHRLRYALPGRFVSTDRDLVPPQGPPPTWTAAWREAAPPGRAVVWEGCEGVLAR